jgi:hypothetical protein
MRFELWGSSAASIIGDYDAESEALEAARNLLERNGLAFAETLILFRQPRHGEPSLIAEGAALVARALAEAATDQPHRATA